MQVGVVTVPLGTTYADVMRMLRRHDISGLPVIGEGGTLVGIVSEKDLFRILYPFYESYYSNPEQYADHEEREKKAFTIKSHPVELFMTKNVFTVEPDMPIMRAGAIMMAKKIHRLPVVQEGRLVGIVTRRSIFQKIMELNYGDMVDAEA